ncbi:rrna processing-related protein [Ceraceosorus bombacis]|uniref:Ribosome biogenesis protein ERB1 n=1 Tax=Ceraceosorus bombacis TaxID=401625 RepID=A0A0P1BN64_9BASI|nr:rrna processing-related protein [Ceraceosorus bombacis]
MAPVASLAASSGRSAGRKRDHRGGDVAASTKNDGESSVSLPLEQKASAASRPRQAEKELALDLDDEDVEEDLEEDDQGVDAFPEIDPELSEVEDVTGEGSNEDENDERSDADVVDGSEAESEEGFDSEEVDNWDEDEEDALADELAEASASDSEVQRNLDDMVARHTFKPDETAPTYNSLGQTESEAAPSIFRKNQNADGSARGEIRISAVTGQPKRVYPKIEADYDSDDSTEDAPNRIGNVPIEWYDDMPHIGYDVNGKKVMRPAQGDELDRFLATQEDPDSWMSAEDRLTGKNVKLSDEELDIIRRLQQGEIPDAAYDQYADYQPWYTGPGKQLDTPLTNRPEPKSRFVPSKWEHKKVMKIVRAIRQGRITPRAPPEVKPEFYNIWNDSDEPRADHPMHMPAPRQALPTHAESYNPPAEYLFSEQERKEWEDAEPEDRKLTFMPAKYGSFRLIPGYKDGLKERFERCLDLYMAPRMRRAKLDIKDAESLIPKLPAPRELRPFPTVTSLVYPHPGGIRVRCLAFDPRGQWLITGAEDGRVRLWDTAIGRCAAVWDVWAGAPAADRAPVYGLDWCPNKSYSFFAAASTGRVLLVAPPQCTPGHAATQTPSFLYATAGYQPAEASNPPAGTKAPAAKWTRPTDGQRAIGVAALIEVGGTPKALAWHAKGDYLATVASDAGSSSVLIHQISRQRTQAPFARAGKGSSVQKVVFHPLRPHLFVATQRLIRVYDLAAQALTKTLQPGVKYISSMDVHPRGEHLIIGSYDRRLVWFDMELSTRPYKTLRYHSRALRAVAFHHSYPLFTSVSDDGTAHVLHGTVYNDLTTAPLLVPLKVLRGHSVSAGLGILDAKWHPTQPWLATAGADGEARLWTI